MKFPSSIAIGVGVITLGIFVLAWRMWTYEAPRAAQPEEVTAVPEIDPTTLAIYANGQLGVSFAYPATATIAPGSTPADDVNPRQGWTTVAEVTDGPASAVVRVWMSEEVGRCPAWSPADRLAGTIVAGNKTWDVRTRDVLGTENERRVVEYRSAAETRCYSVVETGPASSPSAGAIAPAILAQFHGVSQERAEPN